MGRKMKYENKICFSYRYDGERWRVFCAIAAYNGLTPTKVLDQFVEEYISKNAMAAMRSMVVTAGEDAPKKRDVKPRGAKEMKKYEIYTRAWKKIIVTGRIVSESDDPMSYGRCDEFEFTVGVDEFPAAVAEYFDDDTLRSCAARRADIEIEAVRYDPDVYDEEMIEAKELSDDAAAMEWCGEVSKTIWDKKPHVCVNLYADDLDEYKDFYSENELRDMAIEAIDDAVESMPR